jgi:DNA-binding MarR family transcriptional regulator
MVPSTESVHSARIAVYDSMLAAPRVVEIEESDISAFIENIADTTYRSAKELGGRLPFTVIHEIAENFIHAHFLECTVSILEGGNTIRFSDQGPGIRKKEQVLEPGVTSASQEMKRYIKGVGSGFPIVNEFLQTSGGYLLIDDNAVSGAVITIALTSQATSSNHTHLTVSPHLQENSGFSLSASSVLSLKTNEVSALEFIYDNAVAGPTDLSRAFKISTATAFRTLKKLENQGFIERTPNKKRIITNSGVNYIDNVRSNKHTS